MNDFIQNFANQWDETEPEVFTPECAFHDLEEFQGIIADTFPRTNRL